MHIVNKTFHLSRLRNVFLERSIFVGFICKGVSLILVQSRLRSVLTLPSFPSSSSTQPGKNKQSLNPNETKQSAPTYILRTFYHVLSRFYSILHFFGTPVPNPVHGQELYSPSSRNARNGDVRRIETSRGSRGTWVFLHCDTWLDLSSGCRVTQNQTGTVWSVFWNGLECLLERSGWRKVP